MRDEVVGKFAELDMTSGLVDQAGLVDQHAGRPALLRNLETLVDAWSTNTLVDQRFEMLVVRLRYVPCRRLYRSGNQP